MNNITILTFTAKHGWKYEYRKADGMVVAPFGSWKSTTNKNGEPSNENDIEFDEFVDLYISESEFYNLTDEELNNNYKDY